MSRGSLPRQRRSQQRRVQRDRLELDAVAAVEEAELVRVERLQRPLPRPDLLLEDAEDRSRRVQPKPAADVRVRQAGAEQQAPASRSRRAAATTARAADLNRAGVDACRSTVLDEHAPRLRADHDPRSCAGGVLEPRPQRRLLRPERAAVAARAADDALLAADDVARHRLDVPAERLERRAPSPRPAATAGCGRC